MIRRVPIRANRSGVEAAAEANAAFCSGRSGSYPQARTVVPFGKRQGRVSRARPALCVMVA